MDEAKDIFQQSIVVFYENVRSGKLTHISTKVKTYIFSIGKNKLFELIKVKNKRQTQYGDQAYLDNYYFYNEVDDDYEEKLKNVETCLKKMGNPCRHLLEQFYYHKKSMTEISEIMEYKNSETAKTLKYKCLKRLREIFKSEFGTFNEQMV